MACTTMALSTGLSGMVRPATAPRAARARMVVTAKAKKSGFGQTGTLAKQGKKAGKEKIPERFLQNISDGPTTSTSASGFKGTNANGWNKIADKKELDAKNPLPIILASGKGVIIWDLEGTMYCTDVESSAFRYPLMDGEVFDGPKGKAIRCKLDGTEYDLATGEVLKWCPKDTMVRKFLGTLKSDIAPVPINVYPIEINDEDELFVKFV